jgi:hypothetical protein
VLSSTYYPEWLPPRQFSFFEIGAPISTCLNRAGVSLDPAPAPARGEAFNGLLEQYEFSPLAARIYTVCGRIHQIAPEKVCLYRGINLIGSHLDSVLALLGRPPVEWSSLGCCGNYGEIRQLGLFLGVNEHTNTIYNVMLRSLPEEYYARQQLLQSAMMGSRELEAAPGRAAGSGRHSLN